MDLKQLYQDIILEHGKSPKNKGRCKEYNHDAVDILGSDDFVSKNIFDVYASKISNNYSVRPVNSGKNSK